MRSETGSQPWSAQGPPGPLRTLVHFGDRRPAGVTEEGNRL